jgi:hypothetical protein
MNIRADCQVPETLPNPLRAKKSLRSHGPDVAAIIRDRIEGKRA